MRKILPHAAIILSLMYFVFFGIDRVNSIMAFIDNDLTKWLLVVLCVISITNALTLIRDDRARERRRQQLRRRSHSGRQGNPQIQKPADT